MLSMMSEFLCNEKSSDQRYLDARFPCFFVCNFISIEGYQSLSILMAILTNLNHWGFYIGHTSFILVGLTAVR